MASTAMGSRTSLNLGAGLVVEEVVGAQKEEPSPCGRQKLREDEKSFGHLGVLWTAKQTNKLIIEQINPEFSLKAQRTRLKLSQRIL